MNELTQNTLIMTEPRPIDQNPAAVYIASLPAVTGQRTQAQALHVIAQVFNTDVNHLDWSALRYEHTQMIRARLMGVYAPASANKILSALRQVLKSAWLLGQMSEEDRARAVQLKPVNGETLPAGRGLSAGEFLALMNACQADETATGARDAAIIALMYACGLRRGDVVSITMDALNLESWEIKLTGKRNKQREVFIEDDGARDALKDWLVIRGDVPGALFVEVNKGGKVLTEREEIIIKQSRRIRGVDVPNQRAGLTTYRGGALTSQSIYNMLVKRAGEAGVSHFSPHDIRRSFISDLLDAGADIATVAKMAGHANVQTTGRYDRRPKGVMKKAASLLHVPYKSKGG